VNVRLADAIIINKTDTANYDAVLAASPIFVADPEAIRGKRVLVVEDGPTLTHGGMKYGAGWIAARRFGAKEIIDPRPFAVKSIADTYKKYPATGKILPAMGYGDDMVRDLEETINASDAELVIIGTPIDLSRVLKINKPTQRVRYELQEVGSPTIADLIREKFEK
jgi:predicted GTPase